MLVRLRQAATVLLKDIGHHWHPAGSEVEIPEEHFDPALHEDLTAAKSVGPADSPIPSPPQEAAGIASPADSPPVASDSSKEPV